MVKSRPTIDPEKKARILTEATRQFAHHGYRDAKTDDIAAAAEVSKGLIFKYFGSKDELYLQTVQATYDKIIELADMDVWSGAKDLEQMIQRALKYKIEMQLQYPDEFTLSMQAYAEVGTLPADLRPRVEKIWTSATASSLPDMVRPVIERLPLKPGISVETIIGMVYMISNAIGEQGKVMIQANPNIQIAEFDPVVEQAMEYMRILEHGFLADDASK